MCLGVVVHICNPSTIDIEAGGLRVQGQSRLQNGTVCSLCFSVSLSLKKREQ
jgi:hypothetical protein